MIYALLLLLLLPVGCAWQQYPDKCYRFNQPTYKTYKGYVYEQFPCSHTEKWFDENGKEVKQEEMR